MCWKFFHTTIDCDEVIDLLGGPASLLHISLGRHPKKVAKPGPINPSAQLETHRESAARDPACPLQCCSKHFPWLKKAWLKNPKRCGTKNAGIDSKAKQKMIGKEHVCR